MFCGPASPGETPIDDVSGLLLKGILVRAELNRAEADNIRKATVKYLGRRLSRRKAPFDLVWARRLHQEMFGKVWSWAGNPREKSVNLGAAPHQIEPLLDQLLGNLRHWTDLSLIEQAARLHHQAVAIHPFNNGNGRWARLLANIWLKLHKAAPTLWPDSDMAHGASPIRDEYLSAIRAADQEEYEALVALHAKYSVSVG